MKSTNCHMINNHLINNNLYLEMQYTKLKIYNLQKVLIYSLNWMLYNFFLKI
jgi:hypothetical protein